MDPTLTYSVKPQLCHLQKELSFLKMFAWFFESWDYIGIEDVHLASYISDMDVILQNIDYDDKNLETLANQLQEKVEHLKPEIKEICLDLLDSPVLRCKCSMSDKIYDFFWQKKNDKIYDFYDFTVTIDLNLKYILGSKVHMIVPVKEQIEALQKKLKLFGDFLKFTAERRLSYDEELRDFIVQVQAWTIKVASLSFLHWADQLEEETVPKLDTRYLDVLQQIKPCSPEAIRKFLGVLKASKSSRFDTFLMGELVASFVDMLLEDLMAYMEDSFRTSLRNGLIILITFLMDPPTECGNDGNQILAKANVVIDEAASLLSSLCVRKEKEGIPNERDFLKRINKLKAEIRENYVQIQDLPGSDFPRTNGLGFVDFPLGHLKEMASSIPFAKYLVDRPKAEIRENYVQIQQWSDFPRTNGLGFVNFLLGKLEEMTSSICFAKCLVLAIQEKLNSIRPYLEDLMEPANKSEELKDLWMRIISVAYAVEHVVDSCFFGDNQIWYKMIRLSIFLEEIEFATTEVKKIRDKLSVEMNSSQAILERAKNSRIDEVVVGFKEEANAIINQLTRGSKELQIVSIVGMPGQGKTTLANKVCNDPFVKGYFHIRAWCFVSQVYQKKQLLLDILSGVTGLDDKIHQMTEEELAPQLSKCLRGRRYLIVMDDIWDIEAWHQLKESFPNDSNDGSRIMFTSRMLDITSQAGLDSSTHHLRPLFPKESWELLQKKLFCEDRCPAYLSKVGLEIVEICGGLPLSIVVTSGVLAKRIKDLNWWKEIATNLSPKILDEGCMNILELSYNHLPDILKPCFLYFGAFRQGKAVKVQKLTQLWVAEGFIPKIGEKRLEDVAKDLLMDLIRRSLVIVVKRSSDGGIKECCLHDLLFDLCLARVKQERFLRHLKDSQYTSNITYEQYRLSIHTKWRPFVESNPTVLYARSLLSPGDGNGQYHPNAFRVIDTKWWDSDDEAVPVHRLLRLLRVRSHLEDVTKYLNDNHPKDASFFMKLKFLRVLDLEYGVSFDGLPKEIISLIHLRYLAIGGRFRLPPDIENFQNLEVLRVHFSSGEAKVPATIWKMKRLRHICLRKCFSFSNSVHEDAQLDNVDTLSCPVVRGNERGEELLRRFPKVRKLQFLLQGSQFPVLNFLKDLESLNVHCCKRMYHPCDFKFPSTLKKLTLSGSALPWSEISAIGKLPNLEVLKLLDNAFVGNSWYVEDEGFSNLKFLELQALSIQQWNAGADHFPCLQRLRLKYCHKLQEIPLDFENSSSLNLIEVYYCSEGAESSAEVILNGQQEMGGFEVRITSYIQ